MEFQRLAEKLFKEIDPVTISTELNRLGVIRNEQHGHILHLFNEDRNREEIWSGLLKIVEIDRNVVGILKVLEHCGYDSLALKLYVELVSASRCLPGIQRLDTQSSSRQFAQRLFISLKSQTHDNSFLNPRQFLNSLSCRFKKKFEEETCMNRKRIRADKYAAVLCAEIDSHTMLYKTEFPKHGLFEDLRKIIDNTSNSFVTSVAYNARLGIAYAIAEDLDKANDHLKNARMASHNIEQCVEMDNMLYIHVFNLICEYEKSPSVDLQTKITEMAQMGLQCLENDEDNIRVFWKRMFFLRMIYCNLGFSNKGDPVPGSIVTAACLQRSKKLLGEIDKLWNGMEERRKMFYYSARARVNEIERNFDSAIAYLNNAIKIATDGHFGELAYIANYAEKIKDMRRCNMESQSFFTSSPIGMIVTNQEQFHDEQTFVKMV